MIVIYKPLSPINNKGGRNATTKRQTFSDELHKLVGSKIFSAKFTKKDGSDRVINCMLGVKKHLRGGERTTNKEEFMIVFDTIKKQYRNINLKTLDTGFVSMGNCILLNYNTKAIN